MQGPKGRAWCVERIIRNSVAKLSDREGRWWQAGPDGKELTFCGQEEENDFSCLWRLWLADTGCAAVPDLQSSPKSAVHQDKPPVPSPRGHTCCSREVLPEGPAAAVEPKPWGGPWSLGRDGEGGAYGEHKLAASQDVVQEGVVPVYLEELGESSGSLDLAMKAPMSSSCSVLKPQ
jgi:hypothetical protein